MSKVERCFLVVFAAASLLSGCGFDPLPAPEPQPVTGPEAYRIGVLDGPLADELEEGMQLVPHTGAESDKPIVLAAAAVEDLSADQVTAINEAHQSGHPIVLVHAGLEDILAMQRLLGNDAFEYDLPDGVPYAELYATDLETDGSIWQWSLFPPISIATAHSETTTQQLDDGSQETTQTPAKIESLGYDNDENQDSRAAVLFKWIAENEKRMQASDAQAAKLQATQAAADSEELTTLGKAFTDQWNFQQSGNNYQIAHFAWRVHSIADNQDWFYVQQKCIFSASKAYTTAAKRTKGWYLNSVELDAWIVGYENKPAAVGLIQSSPQTANNETQVTSGVSWTIGGEVAVDQNGPSAKLNGGVTISDSTTVIVRDCNVLDLSNDKGNNAHWKYQFKVSQVEGFWDDRLSNPPYLSVTTFQPTNQWIWRMSPEVRVKKGKSVPLQANCMVTLENTDETYNFLYYKLKRSYSTVGATRTIFLPFPSTK